MKERKTREKKSVEAASGGLLQKHKRHFRNSSRLHRGLLLGAEGVLFVALIGVLAFTIVQEVRAGNGERLYDEMQQMKQPAQIEDAFFLDLSDEYQLETPDFEALQAMNPDIYAWITIPDTEVDYPVVQRVNEDGYYLKTNINGTSGYPGCIYSESANSKTFADRVTILYGHNMRDGSMFGALHDYEEDGFLEEHQTIYVQTPTDTLEYRVIAAGRHDDAYLFEDYDFSSSDGVKSLVNQMMQTGSAVISAEDIVSISDESRFLILSTCNKWNGSTRYLVVAESL